MKVPQIPNGVMHNGKEITTPLGVPRNPIKVGEKIKVTNPDLLLDPSKPGYIIKCK
tara:strand:+ start:1542 stop:1709 length:168 start_codon:yes stop_codon:yes gene_type:complete